MIKENRDYRVWRYIVLVKFRVLEIPVTRVLGICSGKPQRIGSQGEKLVAQWVSK
jgi:hypothetical protein